MATVEAIESAVTKLSAHELAEFRKWFTDFDGIAWDEQFEQNVRRGKLDELAAKAVVNFRAGNFREL